MLRLQATQKTEKNWGPLTYLLPDRKESSGRLQHSAAEGLQSNTRMRAA